MVFLQSDWITPLPELEGVAIVTVVYSLPAMCACNVRRRDVCVPAMQPACPRGSRLNGFVVTEPPAKRPRIESLEKERALALRKKHVA